jgi:peptidoglycan/LPS O-acetylase OafA/YrhL
MSQAKQNLVTSNNKLLGLEVIRFISAFAVLFWHYQHFSFIAYKPSDFVTEQQPFYSIFSFFYNYGFFGVQVFWCISGFIFFWKYRDTIANKLISSKQFFVLRFSRLYPLHILTLLLVLSLQIAYFLQKHYFFVLQHNDAKHFMLQIFFASNWGFQNGGSFNVPIWSLSVEVLIYILFFLFLRIFGRSIYINIGIVLLCVIAKMAKVPSPIIDCLTFFYIGGFSAIAFQHIEKSKYKKLFDSLSIIFVILAPPATLILKLHEFRYFSVLFLMIYTPVLLYCAAHDFKTHPAIKNFIEMIGNLTYSSYLMHFPIQLLIALFCIYAHIAIPFYSNIFFVFFMTFTLLISYFIYRFFEKPAQTIIRNRFL